MDETKWREIDSVGYTVLRKVHRNMRDTKDTRRDTKDTRRDTKNTRKRDKSDTRKRDGAREKQKCYKCSAVLVKDALGLFCPCFSGATHLCNEDGCKQVMRGNVPFCPDHRKKTCKFCREPLQEDSYGLMCPCTNHVCEEPGCTEMIRFNFDYCKRHQFCKRCDECEKPLQKDMFGLFCPCVSGDLHWCENLDCEEQIRGSKRYCRQHVPKRNLCDCGKQRSREGYCTHCKEGYPLKSCEWNSKCETKVARHKAWCTQCYKEAKQLNYV